MSHPFVNRLLSEVVSGGYCIGCGACAHVPGTGIRMEMDSMGRLQPAADPSTDGGAGYDPALVCPFSGKAANEDELAPVCGIRHPLLGSYLHLFAGHVLEGDYRSRGSSGGMGSWLPAELLKRGRVDAVLHVRSREETPDDLRLFAYAVSRTADELRDGAKSHYYPAELSEVLRVAAETPGRYAVIGLPCFIKAVRLLMRRDPVLAHNIRYCIALVCGHLKTAAYGDCLAWQCGVPPGALQRIDFRVKIDGRGADEYGVEAQGAGCGGTAPAGRLFGTDWGLGFFKYGACDYCDDVTGETADISVGDAWLPQYTWDSLGTNLVIVRHPELQQLLQSAATDGRLHLETLGANDAVRSQRAAFFHRREALAYRLHLARQAGRWHPPKRVEPRADGLSTREQRKHALRRSLAEASHTAFRKAVEAGDFDIFRREMAPLLTQYYGVSAPFWKRILNPLLHSTRRLRQRLRYALRSRDR